MNNYKKIENKWNKIFSKKQVESTAVTTTGSAILDNGLRWLCAGTTSILDFGCGIGTSLLFCANLGVDNLYGIDLSEKGIELARRRAKILQQKRLEFSQGGIDALQKISNLTFDAVILSNILDNLYPDDAAVVMKEIHRLLVPNGKVLVKLNAFVSKEQIEEYNIPIVQENVLDDGLILWNNTSDEWKKFLNKYFTIHEYHEVSDSKKEQESRVYLLLKKVVG